MASYELKQRMEKVAKTKMEIALFHAKKADKEATDAEAIDGTETALAKASNARYLLFKAFLSFDAWQKADNEVKETLIEQLKAQITKETISEEEEIRLADIRAKEGAKKHAEAKHRLKELYDTRTA